MKIRNYKIEPSANLLGADLYGADLRGADLSGASLRGANLREAVLFRADLRGANLREAVLLRADLRGANLREAVLFRADLHGADLRWANLCEANLLGADLSGANLCGANLHGADLRGANLHGADLRGANLCGANLHRALVSSTCLDPTNKPNGKVDGFRRWRKDKRYVIGFRTRKAGHIDQYRNGRIYNADWFSTADTECHPGLYLWPTAEQAQRWNPDEEIIRVRTKASDVHKAGGKWRCRWFVVWGR